MLSLTRFSTNDVTSRTSAPSVSNDMFCVDFQKRLKFTFCDKQLKFAYNCLAINFILFSCTRVPFFRKTHIFMIVSL